MKLLVLAKAPVPGRVKTRLTPPCTPEQAAGLAAASIADTLAAVLSTAAATGAQPVLVLDGEPGAWIPPEFDVVPQVGGGLDRRLAAAFALGRSDDGPGTPCLLVGMDTPQITPEVLIDALAVLQPGRAGACLGLATDGGWWALGLRRPDPALLLGVPMSTEQTGARTRERLDDAGLDVVDLPVLTDVDTIADAALVAEQAPGSRFAAALDGIRTARVL